MSSPPRSPLAGIPRVRPESTPAVVAPVVVPLAGVSAIGTLKTADGTALCASDGGGRLESDLGLTDLNIPVFRDGISAAERNAGVASTPGFTLASHVETIKLTDVPFGYPDFPVPGAHLFRERLLLRVGSDDPLSRLEAASAILERMALFAELPYDGVSLPRMGYWRRYRSVWGCDRSPVLPVSASEGLEAS